MRFQYFEWGKGKKVYWDMDLIDHSISLTEQLEHLKEDLAQVLYKNDIILDLGWYPEFTSQGEFIIFGIKSEKELKNIPYPIPGLGANSNSWAQSIIEYNNGTGREDFSGRDWGASRRIPYYYFFHNPF